MDTIGEFRFFNRYIPIYGTVEEPLFLAVDIARTIDYSVGNTAHMLEQVDEDEKFRINVPTRRINTNGGMHNVQKWFLTENGLYEVLFQSRKPVAKMFKKIVKDKLRDIRKENDWSFDWFEIEACKYAQDPETGLLRLTDIYGDFIEENNEDE